MIFFLKLIHCTFPLAVEAAEHNHSLLTASNPRGSSGEQSGVGQSRHLLSSAFRAKTELAPALPFLSPSPARSSCLFCLRILLQPPAAPWRVDAPLGCVSVLAGLTPSRPVHCKTILVAKSHWQSPVAEG